MRNILILVLLPTFIILSILYIVFSSNSRSSSVDSYTVYDMYSSVTPRNLNIQGNVKVVAETANANALNVSPNLTNASTVIQSDFDLKKIADAYDKEVEKVRSYHGNKETPCSGLGTYICAVSKKNNISPYIIMGITFAESTYGTAIPCDNNFVGMTYWNSCPYPYVSMNGYKYVKFPKPEDCIDILVNTLNNYRDTGYDISNSGTFVEHYVGVGGGDFDQWHNTILNSVNSISKSSGVQSDVS